MKKITLMLLALVFLTVNIALAAININTADQGALVTLPGIGDKKAAAIVEYRQTHPFKNIKDIQNVKGIGPKIFEKLSKEITTK